MDNSINIAPRANVLLLNTHRETCDHAVRGNFLKMDLADAAVVHFEHDLIKECGGSPNNRYGNIYNIYDQDCGIYIWRLENYMYFGFVFTTDMRSVPRDVPNIWVYLHHPARIPDSVIITRNEKVNKGAMKNFRELFSIKRGTEAASSVEDKLQHDGGVWDHYTGFTAYDITDEKEDTSIAAVITHDEIKFGKFVFKPRKK